eukprot:gene15964-22096_t
MQQPSFMSTVRDCGRDGTASGGYGEAKGCLREEDAAAGKLPPKHGVCMSPNRRRCGSHPSCQLLEIADEIGQLLEAMERQKAVSEKKMHQLANFLQDMGSQLKCLQRTPQLTHAPVFGVGTAGTKSGTRSLPRCSAALVDAPAKAKASKELPTVLPPSLANSVAVLDAPNAAGGNTKVYVLGVSHVTKTACEQVKELIRLVEPEVVMVELCRDRIPLLVSTDLFTQAAGVWHCRKVYVDGLPKREEAPEFPSADELRPLLETRPGRPVSTLDIEADVFTLLKTGLLKSVRPMCQNPSPGQASEFSLFKSVRPMCQNPSPDEAPEFGVRFSPEDGSAIVRCIPPLGAVRYQSVERTLPPIMTCTFRVDSSLLSFPVDEAALEAVCQQVPAESRNSDPTLRPLAANQTTFPLAQSFPVDEAALEAVCQQVLAESRNGDPTLRVLLRSKARFAEAFFGDISISYLNVESGRVEVILKATKSSDAAYVSGFESSAEAGEGWGIDLFRPQRPMHKVSDKMFLTAELLDKRPVRPNVSDKMFLAAELLDEMREAELEGGTDDTSQDGAELAKQRQDNIKSSSTFRIWSTEEVAAAKRPKLGPEMPVQELFVDFMTLMFAKYQAAAGRKIGIEKGAAWQAALQAASEVGTQQFLLSDRPVCITNYRLGEQMASESGVRVAAALTTILGAIIGAATIDAPQDLEVACVGVAVAAGAALLWPVLAPFAAISKLADMKAEEIEDLLTPKTPVTADLTKPFKLFGEDALLDWPGAMASLIEDRDEYMAKAAAAAALGTSYSPAFILDEHNGQLLWRYMQAEGAPAESSPSGFGDGAFQPMAAPRAIVNVVGTAHLPGIVRNWPKALESSEDVMHLLRGKNWEPEVEAAAANSPSEASATEPALSTTAEAGSSEGAPKA